MKRKSSSFFIGLLLGGFLATVCLPGCSIYDKIDRKIHPTPKIGEKVDYQINKYRNGRIDVNFSVPVTDGEMAMFYYSCKTQDGWDDEVHVGSDKVTKGQVINVHVTRCNTQLMVNVIAYHNYGKRSQKHDGKTWLINMKKVVDLL